MIPRELAERLLPIVNDKEVREALEAYATWRISAAHANLEVTADLLHTGRHQGAAGELRRIFKLRDEVLAHSR